MSRRDTFALVGCVVVVCVVVGMLHAFTIGDLKSSKVTVPPRARPILAPAPPLPDLPPIVIPDEPTEPEGPPQIPTNQQVIYDDASEALEAAAQIEQTLQSRQRRRPRLPRKIREELLRD